MALGNRNVLNLFPFFSKKEYSGILGLLSSLFIHEQNIHVEDIYVEKKNMEKPDLQVP